MDREMLEQYFRRIGLALPEVIVPDAELLRRLQSAHAMAVVYDNAELFGGTLYDNTLDGLWQRVVGDGFGGICLDLNRLFGALLRALGYTVRDVTANYYKAPDSPLAHRMLIAEDCTGRRWLCDVADIFDGHLYPVELREGAEHTENGRVFGAERQGDCWVQTELRGGQRQEIWRVYDRDTPEEKFTELKLLGMNSKDAPLMKTRTFSRMTPTGRKTFFAGIYRELRGGETFTKRIGEADEWVYEQFGLEYPSGRDRKWAEQK